MCESPSKPLRATGTPDLPDQPSPPESETASRRLSNGGLTFVCGPNDGPPDDEVFQFATTPPDGGWGWVVVFCSFMVHVLADGVTYSFGIFHLEFLEYFQESNGMTSWVASILVSTTFLCGPLASALTNIYGCRAVTIAGAIIASSGLFVSAWAPNVTCLFFSIGVMTGLGLGLMYLPAIVSVAMYFERRRAFATGIAVCGSGFGTFVLAPVIEALVNYYGWRGALIITAGMLLQCAVFGALMRPPEYELELLVSKAAESQTPDAIVGDVDNNTTLYPNENFASSQHIACKDVMEAVPEIREILELESADKFLKPVDAYGTLHRLGSKDKLHHKSFCHLSVNSEPELVLIRTPSIDRQLYLERDGLSFGRNTSYTSLRKRLSCTSQPSLSLHSVQLHTDQRSPHQKFASFVKTIADSIDLALLLGSPVFILFALSNFFTSIGFNVPYVYIKDVARRKLDVEDSSKAPFLLSLIGLSNTASRVLLGYLSDKEFVNRIRLYNACIGTCGIATALSVFCTNYVHLALYCLTFGATSGAFISLTSVILVDLLGLEKLNNAFGLVLLFEGVACLIGPPLTGSFYDWTGSYDWGFVFSGVVIALGGVMLCLIPCVRPERPISDPDKQVSSDQAVA